MEAVKIGKHYRATFPNGQVVQIVAPADNKDGLYLRYAGAAPGHGYVNLYASTTPPPTPGDVNTQIIFAANGSGRANEQSQVALAYPLMIPAGLGLWASSGSFLAGAAPNGAIYLSWDFIS